MTRSRRPSDEPGDEDDTVVPFRSRSRIGEARVYSPRGTTIREAARGAGDVPSPRATGRDQDPDSRRDGRAPRESPAARTRADGTTARSRAEGTAARSRAEGTAARSPRSTGTAKPPSGSGKGTAARTTTAKSAGSKPTGGKTGTSKTGAGKTSTSRQDPAPTRRATPTRGATPRTATPRTTAASRQNSTSRQSPTARGTGRGTASGRTAASRDRDVLASTRSEPGRRSLSRAQDRFAARTRAPSRPVRPKRVLGSKPPPPRRRLRVPRLGNPGRRLRFAMAVVLFAFAVLAGRLVQIQTVHSAYADEATADRTREVELMAPRGAILDRHGNELARSVEAVEVDADPKWVKDVPKTAKALTTLLGVPESELITKMDRKYTAAGKVNRFAYLARQLDPDVGQAVNALNLPGINVGKEQRRDVPGHDLAANVIGFVGSDGDGLAGIEASYDDAMRGKNGLKRYEVGSQGQEIPDGNSWTQPAQPGKAVQLTIDRDLQYQAQRMLMAQIQAKHAYNGAAVVLDAKTEEILAMASYPSYDAGHPTAATAKYRMDLATGAVVEPGSVHKAITIGGALDAGVIKPDSSIEIGRSVKKGNVTFHDTHYQKNDRTKLTLEGVLAQSSNLGTISIADKLGAQRLYDYQRKFGLGSKIGVGLPGEASGFVHPPNEWSGPSYGSIPIGLGVAVTPLQMTSVFATIANDGVRVPPTLVKGTLDASGKLTPRTAAKPERVLSVQAAQALRADMEAIATPLGTAPAAAIPNYRISGKTGTGQLAENNHYVAGNVTSMIGIVPADAPRYVIGIFVHASAGTGGAVAGPLFSELGKFTLGNYGVAPTLVPPPPIRIYAS
ncbi:MAG: hypothetical protein QOD41_1453 [Cryptosporangiaceae bacterium]|nr:hypothetical protein [Cryptosporangiaceae bacterium]